MWSDPILIKEDRNFLYMLPSIVDDLEYNISSVLRGEDHISNTAIQIEIIKALNDGKCNIEFGHFPLITSKNKDFKKRRIRSVNKSIKRKRNRANSRKFAYQYKLNVKKYFLAKDINEIINHFEIKY